MKTKMKGFVGRVSKKTKSLYFLGLSSLLMAQSSQASNLDTAGIESEAEGIANFIVALLGGWVGYVLTLVAFFAGIFYYFKSRDLWGTMAAFGLAVLIMVVPGVLEGFFDT